MNPKHILLPTDLSELSLRPIERAPELFEGRKVTLLTVVENVPLVARSAPLAPPLDEPDFAARSEEARQELETLAKALPNSAEVEVAVVGGTDDGKSVSKWANEHDVDLIALSTHGRTGLRRFALGSVAESILRHAHVPVLVFPDKEPTGE